MIDFNKIYLGDCMDYLREMPDKSVDLILTDPPYGDGKTRLDPGSQFFSGRNKIRTGGSWSVKYENKIAAWDVAPSRNLPRFKKSDNLGRELF